MLQCPHCHLALRVHVKSEVEIDVCDECRGVWLDHGELEIISNGRDFTPHQGATEDLPDLRCPRCDTEHFRSLEMEEGVLAQCADCHGVFVEGQTIERVVKIRGSGAPSGRSSQSKASRRAWQGYDLAYALGDIFGAF